MRQRLSAVAMACAFIALAIGTAEARPKQNGIIVCDRQGCSDRKVAVQDYSVRSHVSSSREAQIVPNPAGCPARRFCGCGVSVKVFGKPVRDLFLAANWIVKFPRSHPSAGKVAARRGHVFYIIDYLGNGKALAYDPNSGGHKTRIHVRSLAGYTVVDPQGSKVALQ